MPEADPDVHKGLAGVVADVTAVSMVNADTNSLTYRGYPVQELASSCSFEEVAYLIWNGELPTSAQLEEFSRAERALRTVDPTIFEVLAALPVDCRLGVPDPVRFAEISTPSAAQYAGAGPTG